MTTKAKSDFQVTRSYTTIPPEQGSYWRCVHYNLAAGKEQTKYFTTIKDMTDFLESHKSVTVNYVRQP